MSEKTVATTERGFPLPEWRLHRLEHRDDRVYMVRLTRWEKGFLDPGKGITGRIVLLSNDDNTYDLIVTPIEE